MSAPAAAAAATATRCAHLAAALRVLDAVAPLALAAKWDNTGLLVDASAPFTPSSPADAYRVLLTNDLTPAVLDEAVASRSHLIVAYHPPVFSAMKRFTYAGGGQPAAVVLQCARHGIAVYSPHSAWDSVVGGINDWMLGEILPAAGVPAPLPRFAPVLQPEAPAHVGTGAGIGRTVDLSSSPPTLAALVDAVKAKLGLERVQVALPAAHAAATRSGRGAVLAAAAGVPVRSLAVCAGAGSSVLGGVPADAFLTGEMSHHDVLAAAAAGTAVILTNHSNCERGFLPVVAQRLRDAWAAHAAPGLGGRPLEVAVSALDADPLVSV